MFVPGRPDTSFDELTLEEWLDGRREHREPKEAA